MSVIEFLTLFWDLFQFAVPAPGGTVTVMWVVMELIERMEK